jgi:hypothetical protein
MAIFVVLMPSPQPAIVAEIKRHFENDHLPINDTQWLISTGGTAMELTTKLGIYDPKEPAKPSTGNAIIFSTSGYFGRGPTTIWEWMKAKLETSPGG